MMFLVGIIVLFGLFLLHATTRYSRKGRLISKIHGPTGLPVIGNLLNLAKSREKLFYVVRGMVQRYYPIGKLWIGAYAIAGLCHPDDIEIALTSQSAIEKNFMYKFIGAWLKTGLLTSGGDKWRHRRKILTPAFHFHVLNKYNSIVSDQGRTHIETLRNEGKETIQSLMPLCSMFTLRVICEAAFGVDFNKIDVKQATDYTEAVRGVGEVIITRSVKPYLLDWIIYPFMEIGRKQKKFLKILHDFSSKVVRERREYHKQTEYKYLQEFDDQSEKSESIYLGRRKRFAMLDLLLSAERKGLIDNEGILEEVDTFTFEGHDTSGSALIFVIMLLAENKEIQDIARDEVESLMNKTNGKLSFSDLGQLQYVERCIKETLRLYPSVPIIFRTLTKDVKFTNYVLPAGTDLFCPLFDVHRNSTFWPEPEKFDPDRFLPERSVGRHPFSYLPFSAGQRNCIGQKFAMMELKSLVTRILYNFYLEPVDRTCDLRFIMDLVLRPAHDVRTKFIRIDRTQ